MDWCWGRECKLGWGYNEDFKILIPVQGQPPNVRSEVINKWKYDLLRLTFRHYVTTNLSSIDISCLTDICLILEPNYKKLLDFQIIFDNNQYWLVPRQFWKQEQKCDKLPNYPPNCSHFVNKIRYGVDLWILFPKIGFLEKDYEIKDLFEKRNFNETQKQAKCKVLINYNEIREITLAELSQFMNEIERGRYSQYYVPVGFDYEKLNQNIKRTSISNEDKFTQFLSYLYCLYRKIEIKLENAGYPNVLPDLESQETMFYSIRANLDNAKENFKYTNRNDFLKMYPILKRLFFCYTDYIKCASTHLIDMDEGDHLPGTVDEIKLLLQTLNTWVPAQVRGKWVNCTGSFVVIPPAFQQVAQILHNTAKPNNYPVVNDNTATEPYITEQNKKVLFGFVDMTNPRTDQISATSALLERECPRECTKDPRKWICITCGDYVAIKLDHLGFQFFFCSCGSKRYKDELLICNHTKRQHFNYNDLLRSIRRELEQIREREEGRTDIKIHTAINYIVTNRSEEGIRNALTDLQGLTLDSNLRHMIHLYLNRNN